MRSLNAAVDLVDNGGRRTGTDRRRVSIPAYGPETRSRQDRRGGQERRRGKSNLILLHPKRGTDRYMEWFRTIRGLFWGVCFGSLVWGIIIVSIVLIRAR